MVACAMVYVLPYIVFLAYTGHDLRTNLVCFEADCGPMFSMGLNSSERPIIVLDHDLSQGCEYIKNSIYSLGTRLPPPDERHKKSMPT